MMCFSSCHQLFLILEPDEESRATLKNLRNVVIEFPDVIEDINEYIRELVKNEHYGRRVKTDDIIEIHPPELDIKFKVRSCS